MIHKNGRMCYLFYNHELDKKIEKLRVRTKKIFSFFPSIMGLVLAEPDISSIFSKIHEEIPLTNEDIDLLKNKYIEELDRYKKICLHIANWGGLFWELFFLDSLDSHVTEKIYHISPEYIQEIEAVLTNGSLSEEYRQEVGKKTAAQILEMTLEELESYADKQEEEYFWP